MNGRVGHGIDWRDVIGALVRRPGAFRRYRYRDALFPTATFRRAFERLEEALSAWSADRNYLQLLQRASETMLAEVEPALERVLEAGEVPTFERVVRAIEPPLGRRWRRAAGGGPRELRRPARPHRHGGVTWTREASRSVWAST